MPQNEMRSRLRVVWGLAITVAVMPMPRINDRTNPLATADLRFRCRPQEFRLNAFGLAEGRRGGTFHSPLYSCHYPAMKAQDGGFYCNVT